MQPSTEKIIESSFKNRVLTETDLTRLFGGSAARRYGLVNKALKRGELIRLRRGLYTIASRYRTEKFSRFMLANHIVPYSYVSLESALSYHNWIPEKVVTVFSVVSSGRHRTFTTVLGDFEYYHLPTKPFEFLTSVIREDPDQRSFLIATPLRALADYIYIRKPECDDIEFLQQSLRIELEMIRSIKLIDIVQLQQVFHSRRVIKFLKKLKKEIKKL